jgi:putative transposase
MPPPWRNHRQPTADDTPTATAACSLVTPSATSRQNSRSISRRCDGAPGDFIGDRPVNSFIQPAGLPINTSTIKVLPPPVEPSQYLSIAYTERLAEIGIEPSVGSVGDSYDNALAETIIGLYKTELVYNLGPFDGLDDLELATFEYVDWFNHRRLMGNTTPAETEETYHQHQHETPKTKTLH